MKLASSVVAALLGLAAVSAYADPASNGGVLTINGALIASTCDVSGNSQGNNFIVTLPTLSASELSAAGSTGFDIALSNCTPATGSVRTFWEYGANTLADGNLLNNGTADSVEVQLVDYNKGQNVIDVSKADGAQNSQSVDIKGGSASLQYAAQYISPKGGAGAGSVTTKVTYSMIYQ
ncbi:fimbrial protein [Candidatus Burkholderia verschuerenii]|nr:fimbrial protein [Candidatus Burkholderia verschuerenii]